MKKIFKNSEENKVPLNRRYSQEFESQQDLQRGRDKIEYDNEMCELRNDIEEMLNQLDSTRILNDDKMFLEGFDEYDTGKQLSIMEDAEFAN